MEIHRTSKTGPALEDAAYEIGGDSSTADTGIVKSTRSGEAFAYRGEMDRYAGEYAADVAHVGGDPIGAALLLFGHVDLGEIWDSDRKVLVGQPYDSHIEDLIDENTGEDWEITSGDSDYRYIDDMSRRGGMMYHEDDYHSVGGHFFTRPSVEENPEPYIEALLREPGAADAHLIEDRSVLEDLGFASEGEYKESMHSTETSTSPTAKREKLEEEGKDVIFFATGSKHNPFRTEFEIFVRPKRADARA